VGIVLADPIVAGLNYHWLFAQTPDTAGYGFSASVTTSGLMLLPMSAAMFGMGQVTGRLVRIFGARNLIVVGSVLSAAALAFLALQHSQPWDVYMFAAILGVGAGTALAAMSGVIVATAIPAGTTSLGGGSITPVQPAQQPASVHQPC
jgi:MFS family permease